MKLTLDMIADKDDTVAVETSVGAKRRYICPIDDCSKAFGDQSSYRKHQITHAERTYVCPVAGCNKRFLDNSKLKRHQLVHTGEKPYKCHICDKRFSLDFNLRTHLRTHTGEKPYVCPWPKCFRRFTQSSNLTAHEKTHTMREGTQMGAGLDLIVNDLNTNGADDEKATSRINANNDEDAVNANNPERNESGQPKGQGESSNMPPSTPQIIFSTLRQDPRPTQPQAIFNINKDPSGQSADLQPAVQFVIEHKAQSVNYGQTVNTLGITPQNPQQHQAILSGAPSTLLNTKAQIFEVIQGDQSAHNHAHHNSSAINTISNQHQLQPQFASSTLPHVPSNFAENNPLDAVLPGGQGQAGPERQPSSALGPQQLSSDNFLFKVEKR